MNKVEDEIKDAHADKARILWSELRDTDFHDGRNKIAAALRSAAADAYEDAENILGDLDCYCCQHDEHPEGLCLIKSKAATLRAPAEPKEGGANQ